MGSTQSKWEKCAKISYRQANKNNRKECALKASDIWPGTVTKVKAQLLNPPQQEMEWAAIKFAVIGAKMIEFSTDDQPIIAGAMEDKGSKDASRSKVLGNMAMKSICWGKTAACTKKFARGGTKTAQIAGTYMRGCQMLVRLLLNFKNLGKIVK